MSWQTGRARRARTLVVVLSLLAAAAGAQRPKVQTLTVDNGLPSAHVYGLAQDPRSGRVAILTRIGVTLYDGHDFVTYTHAEGLPSGGAGAVAIGPDGGLWTMARWDVPRVCRLEGRWWCASPPSGLAKPSRGAPPSVEMTSLAVTERAGTPVAAIGSRGAGLWLWDGEAESRNLPVWQNWRLADGLPSDDVYVVAFAGEGLALGTGAGLCFLREDVLDCRLRERIPKLRDPILALAADAVEEGAFWILSSGWLGRLEAGRLEVVASGEALAWISAIRRGVLAADVAGNVYFGNERAAAVWDSEDRRITPLGHRQGLASDGTTALLLDREANVWVGSPRGLSRVESRRFLSFDEDHGLLEDEVTALVEPLSGRFVLAHNKGLTLLELERGSTVRLPFDPPPTPSAYRVMDLALDPGDGSVWMASNTQGLLQLELPFGAGGGAPAPPDPKPGWRVRLPSPAILSVEFDTAGRLWAMSADRLFVRDGGRFVPWDHDHGGLGALRWLEAGPDGSLYVSTARGLLAFDGAEWRLAQAAGRDANVLYGLHVTPSGDVWVGTLAGLYRLRGQELVAVREEGFEVDRPVYLILEDGVGRLWFGTDDGVFVWDGTHLRHLSVPQGLAGRETNRAAGLLDRRGRVWIGTDRGVSVHQERYDRLERPPPLVELGALEINGLQQPLEGELQLAPHQNQLTFHFRVVTFATDAGVEVRYRLEPFDAGWRTRAASAGEIRYTNVPPGRYRFELSAGRVGAGDGAWSPAVRSPEILIPRPFWRRPWVRAATLLATLLVLASGYRLRTRSLRRRAREREAMIAELEEKNAELERFTYTVSHDLKSPLVTITGFLGLLRRDVARREFGRLEHDIQRIQEAADRMGRLLGELLELSRIGRVIHPPERVGVGELAGEALELLAGRIAQRDVEIEIAPNLPVVEGDRVRLREVFQNLIDNAVRFQGQQEHPRIEIGARSLDGNQVLFVRDNGVGIDPSYHEKIFGLFERLDPEIEGTGIGLALVKRIVELHGGHVWVESEGEGKGSTFCFTLEARGPETP